MRTKKVISLFVALVMTLSLAIMPQAASAEESAVYFSGNFDNMTPTQWTNDNNAGKPWQHWNQTSLVESETGNYLKVNANNQLALNLKNLGVKAPGKYKISMTFAPESYALGSSTDAFAIYTESGTIGTQTLGRVYADNATQTARHMQMLGTYKGGVGSNMMDSTTPWKIEAVLDTATGALSVSTGIPNVWTFSGSKTVTVMTEDSNAGYIKFRAGGSPLYIYDIKVQQTVDITATAGAGGSVSGGGAYRTGETVTLTATAETGYEFAGWYADGVLVSNEATYTFTAEEAKEFSARFKRATALNYVEDFSGMTADEWKNNNNSGKPWQHWNQTSLVESETGNYLKVNANNQLALNLKNLGVTAPGKYKISMTINPESYSLGSSTDAFCIYTESGAIGAQILGQVYADSSTATSRHMRILGSYKGGVGSNMMNSTTPWKIEAVWDTATGALSSSAGIPDVWTFSGSKTVTAMTEDSNAGYIKFRAGGSPLYIYNIKVQQAIEIGATVQEGGTVTGAGSYVAGDSVTLTATAEEGYEFKGWYDGDTLVSADAAYTFTVEGAKVFTAKFEGKAKAVNYVEDFNEMTADEWKNNNNSGKPWRHWNVTSLVDISEMSTDINKKGKMTGNALKLSAKNTLSLSLSGLGLKKGGKYVIEYDTLQEAFVASGWDNQIYFEGGGLSAKSISIVLDNGWLSMANQSDGCGGMSVSKHTKLVLDTANNKVSVSITDNANAWTKGPVNMSVNFTDATSIPDLKFGTVSSNPLYIDNVSVRQYADVAVTVDGYGKVTGTGVKFAGDTVTLNATPLVGCTFDGWYLNDELVSQDAEYSFVVEENVAYVAKFSGTPQHNIFRLDGYEYNEDFSEMNEDTYETMPWVDASKASFDDENNRIVIAPKTNLALDLDEFGIDEKGVYEIRVGMAGGDETPTASGFSWNAYFDGGQELLAEYWETSGGIAGNVEQRANRIFGVYKAIYGAEHHGWDMLIRWNTSTGEMTVIALDQSNMWSTSSEKTITKYTKGNFPALYLNAGFETLYIDYLSVKYIPADMSITSENIKFYVNDTVQKSWNELSPETDKITIDFGTEIVSASGITLTDSEGTAVAFEGEVKDNSYVLNLTEGLKPVSVYTLTVDDTVENVMGETTDRVYTAKIKTGAKMLKGDAVVTDAFGNKTDALADATGLKIDYVNKTGKSQDINIIENYYNGGVLVATSITKYQKDASVSEDTITHTLTKPSDAYTSAKIMVWNGFAYMETIAELIELSSVK